MIINNDEIIFRSIGSAEMNALLIDGHVHGRYDCSVEPYTECGLKNVSCFFNEKIIWKDIEHTFLIGIIPRHETIKFQGKSKWWVYKNFEKTHRVYSSKGPNTVFLDEVYLSEYSLDDVFFIRAFYPISKKYRDCKIQILDQKFYNIKRGVWINIKKYNYWENNKDDNKPV